MNAEAGNVLQSESIILNKWGFTCQKSSSLMTTRRSNRCQVTSLKQSILDKLDIGDWKNIQVDDQIVAINGKNTKEFKDNAVLGFFLLNEPAITVEFENEAIRKRARLANRSSTRKSRLVSELSPDGYNKKLELNRTRKSRLVSELSSYSSDLFFVASLFCVCPCF